MNMWPFKKKPSEPIKYSPITDAIEELISFRDIGETFNYLGVTMIVEGHSQLDGFRIVPVILAAYKNDHGEIKNYYFYPRNLPALIAENSTD